jgi:hypothetical protein
MARYKPPIRLPTEVRIDKDDTSDSLTAIVSLAPEHARAREFETYELDVR